MEALAWWICGTVVLQSVTLLLFVAALQHYRRATRLRVELERLLVRLVIRSKGRR